MVSFSTKNVKVDIGPKKTKKFIFLKVLKVDMYKRLFYDPAMAKSKNVEKVETRGRPAVSEDTQLTPKQWKFVEIVATQGEFMTLRDCAVEEQKPNN